jgi:NAD(P)-dependent dehydrogenase (short-subunit alcohol dehydrogenase family)
MPANNRMAIVTGAGSGIGRAIALALAAGGSPVAALDLDGASAEETANLITKAGGKGKAFQGDTSKAADLDRAVAGAVAALGPLEIMVNNAGILDGYFNVDEMSEAVFHNDETRWAVFEEVAGKRGINTKLGGKCECGITKIDLRPQAVAQVLGRGAAIPDGFSH